MLAAAVLVNYLICYKLLTQESMLDKILKVKKKKNRVRTTSEETIFLTILYAILGVLNLSFI